MDIREQLAVYAKAIMDKDAEIKKLTRMLNEAIDVHITVEIENIRLRDMLIIVSQWIDKDPAYSELHQQVLSVIRK